MAGFGTAVAAARFAVKNKDKIGKLLIRAISAIVMCMMLISASILSLVSAFVPEGVLKRPGESDICNTAIYKSVTSVTDPHFASIKQMMEEEKERIIAANTVEETITDESGKKQTVKKCNVKITRKFNYFGLAYLISYLQHTGNLEEKTGKINEEEAEKFLMEIERIAFTQVSENEHVIENKYLDVDDIASLYFHKESDKTRFQASCKAYAEFFGVSEAEVIVDDINIYETNEIDTFLEIPLYLQYKGPWAQVPYGGKTIAKNGCCPTCIAMVLSYLKQENILPSDIVAWSGDKYYVKNAGTSWSIFPAVAQNWDVTCTNLGKDTNKMLQALEEGKPVIASMSPGTFTQGGHFIVLTGIKDGGITVNDPNDNARKNFKDQVFSVSLISREAKQYWSFEDNGE